MRAALYARISDDREGLGLGVERQLHDGRALVASRGGIVVMERSDNDISAFRGRERPGYDDIMAAAQSGDITHIVVFHMSRLWRNRRERGAGMDLLAKSEVGILFTQGGDLDLSTAAGRMMAGIIGEFDTHESEVKSERILRKVTELAEAGKIANGGPRPFGYTRVFRGDGPRRKIVRDEINEEEAAVIRECVRRCLAGDSLRSIVGYVNDLGVTTTTGRPWSGQAMRYVLRSGRIAGLRERKREVVAKAVWPAIISEDEHRQLLARLDENQRSGTNRVRLHYLSGFVYCSSPACLAKGMRMRVRPAHGKLIYGCVPKSEGGCNGRTIGLAPLEDFIGRYMVARMEDPKVLAEIAARESAVDDEVEQLLALIEKDERRLKELRTSLEDGDEDEVPEVVAAVRSVRRRLAEHRNLLGRRANLPTLAGESLPELASRWADLPLPRKQALVRMFIERIIITPARATGFFDPNRITIVPVGARRLVEVPARADAVQPPPGPRRLTGRPS